jgi:hypothetical protein
MPETIRIAGALILRQQTLGPSVIDHLVSAPLRGSSSKRSVFRRGLESFFALMPGLGLETASPGNHPVCDVYLPSQPRQAECGKVNWRGISQRHRELQVTHDSS